MKAEDNVFDPARSVTAEDTANALETFGISASSLDTLPSDPSFVITKSAFLRILSEAFAPKLKQILKTKSPEEFTAAWNAIPTNVPYYYAVRDALVAGWISMPQGSFQGSAPLNRAEMAVILLRVASSR